jgi:hypothetical protein
MRYSKAELFYRYARPIKGPHRSPTKVKLVDNIFKELGLEVHGKYHIQMQLLSKELLELLLSAIEGRKR